MPDLAGRQPCRAIGAQAASGARLLSDPDEIADIDPHVGDLIDSLLRLDRELLQRWGARLGHVLREGGRLLVAGNGGSAAQAQHLTAELVGRFRTERSPLPAIALAADISAVTAIGNDYGFDEIFARQVLAHGRPGDILLVLSTSGQSPNILAAVSAARRTGMTAWAFTGPTPNPLSQVAAECMAIASDVVATVQECHLVAIHMLCEALEDRLNSPTGSPTEVTRPVSHARRQVGLVVIGDVLLDEDIAGSVERISPEAPVVVVGELTRTRAPGGAGLAATLAARAGHEVILVSAIDDDEGGRVVRGQLAEAGVTLINLGGGGPTAAKTRVRAAGQTLLMLDGATATNQAPGPMPPEAAKAIRDADAVLVADYGRGVAAAEDVRALLAEVAGQVPVVWDPHPLGPPPVPGITLITPNSREVRRIAETYHIVRSVKSGMDDDVECLRALAALWGVGHAVVTRGAEGAVLVSSEPTPPIVVPAPFDAAGDSRGAGDRFAGAVATALGSGLTLSAAVRHAVDAASEFVASPLTSELSEVDRRTNAMAVVARVRAAGGRVVATGGCFDLLHRGHVALLQQARRLGDCLVVCLNSDDSVRRLKGEPRPLVNAADRAGVLEALACVDAVVVFDEDTPEQVLSILRPDVYVKGGDYAIGELLERVVIESGGGRVVLVPYLDGRSTSSLIRRARVTS